MYYDVHTGRVKVNLRHRPRFPQFSDHAMNSPQPTHAWFPASRYGLFIHWGPYSAIGRGEQVLFREHLDQRQYAADALRWNPSAYDPAQWARVARDGGFRYAVLTTRHHDGYCLWDSRVTDYTSARGAPGRDFVREYVEAFRAAGLRVGLYYSLADWRIPAYWNRVADDPDGWAAFRGDVHAQVRELLTGYGTIDVFWFDGSWPHTAAEWDSAGLLTMMRQLQPNILVNNRLDSPPVSAWAPPADAPIEDAGGSRELGDFGTPEHRIVADPHRLWESCQTSTHRLWGYAVGEHWRTAPQLLDMLCESASRGGNLLLNVGPDGEGRIPDPFIERSSAIGRWLGGCGEAIYDTQAGDVFEFVTRGFQTRRGNTLYLILRFFDGRPQMPLAPLATAVKRATLLPDQLELGVQVIDGVTTLTGIPPRPSTDLYPVIRLECDGEPRPHPWATDRLWCGDPRRMLVWARTGGTLSA